MRRILLLLLLIPWLSPAQTPPLPGKHTLKDPERFFRPAGPNSLSDRAVGLLDKGELSNLLTNYGILSDFHLGTPALHWPRAGSDVQHYGFGLDLLLVADGQVASSVYDPSSPELDFGWEAMDGSLGNYFNSTRTPYNTAGDGLTPFLAFSDVRDTWPVISGTPTWPGYYRQNPTNPNQTIPGEFVSDRDVFGVVRDDHNMGLVVKQTAYSYGRPYAEDFIFVRFRIFNQGPTDYASCYVGFQADLKADFYADDYVGDWAIAPYDAKPSFIYKWDYNGIAQRDDSSYFGNTWVGPVGRLGIGLVETPNDLGITSFHYYNDDYSPYADPYFAALLQNHRSAPLENMSRYFHGADSTFDDPALQQEVDDDNLPGTDITFCLGSGPFPLASGDSVDFAIVVAIGAGSTDLQTNVQTAYFMAKERAYQGSGPPSLPNLTAVPGDGNVRIYWDNHAESSVDAISGQMDFEGYKLYKSTDLGLTWGDPITNFYGDRIGWVPLAQFDLVDSITGLDPAYGPNFPNANHWLGNDTGLKHSFTDSNVVNGQQVWYGITAYDRGVFNPDSLQLTEPSYENSLGVSAYDANIAIAIPGTQAINLEPGNSTPFTELGGRMADGQLELTIVDAGQLLDHTYRLTFNDKGDTVSFGPDSFVVADTLTLNLEDATAGTFHFTNSLTGETFDYKNFRLNGDDQPVVNGFRLTALNVDGAGVRSKGWTTVNGDSSTFDWWTEDRHPGNSSSYPEVVEGLDDWRLTVTADSAHIPLVAAGFGFGGEDSVWAHIKIERSVYNQGGIWVDATPFLKISDLQIVFNDTTNTILGPIGWDLIPGGAGYNASSSTGTLWPDMLLLDDDMVDTVGSTVWIKTQNGPVGTLPPSIGDVYTVNTFKPFTSVLTYEFSTQGPTLSTNADLTHIKVVPNPLIISSGLESNPYESKVMFTHLPAVCDIDIYTVAGNRVVSLHHESALGEGFMYWNLLNHEGQNVAYGLYVYVVKSPEGSTKTGKLMVIR
jgi:hypothetical protein